MIFRRRPNVQRVSRRAGLSRRRFSGPALAAIGGILLRGCAASGQSEQFVGDTSTSGANETFERQAFYVPMSDGVKLALSVYRPVGSDRVPTLLWILPDRRESLDPRTGEIVPAMGKPEIAFFNEHGYAIALAEMRGGGASFGARDLDRSPQLGRDGAELVKWIARQPWSDGTLGMVGSSYQGFIQFATAAQKPHGLRAIFPEIAGFDDYGSMFNPGGILNTDLSNFAAASMQLAAENRLDPSHGQLPSVPVVDEDGDGDLTDEIPLDANGNGTFLDEKVIAYSDGEKRHDLYLQATREHLANTQLTIERMAQAPYRDSRLAGTPYTYADLDPGARPKIIGNSSIAVYVRGGWFDYHARDSTLWFATLQGHTPVRLMMAPTGHGGLPGANGDPLYNAGPYFKHFNDSATTNALMLNEKLRFFDHYVRGISNGFEKEDPVLLYVMGEGWRRSPTWPIPRAEPTRFSLGEGGRLLGAPGVAGADQYRVDFGVTSTSGGANRWNYRISRTDKPLTLDGDKDRRLAYVSAPLGADTEVTGHPIIELVMSANVGDADLFVYLEDVAPDGTSLLVSEGELRANYHRLRPIAGMLPPTAQDFGVRPQLPWQGFSQADYDPRPLAGGAKVRLVFDMMPTSWVFRRGHSIRLSIAGADTPSFAVHPAVEEALQKGTTPVWQIWRGAGQSSIVLPVIPAKEKVDE